MKKTNSLSNEAKSNVLTATKLSRICNSVRKAKRLLRVRKKPETQPRKREGST